MSHEIERILAAASASVWAIEPNKAMEIANLLALRASNGVGPGYDGAAAAGPANRQVDGRRGAIHVLQVHGTIFQRSNMMSSMSGGASMEQFGKQFADAAADENAAAIVMDIDSPGGVVSMVEETAEQIFAARRADRPIIAVANTTCASAAYWLASAADQIVAPPSANVGSIGVYTMHDDLSKMMDEKGVSRTFVFEGSRKVEGHPFAPLDDSAREAMQDKIRSTYRSFTGNVARNRGVEVAVVRADPEKADRHFGGGRVYGGREARRLGLVDRVATLDAVLADLVAGRGPRRRGSARASLAAQRMSLT